MTVEVVSLIETSNPTLVEVRRVQGTPTLGQRNQGFLHSNMALDIDNGRGGFLSVPPVGQPVSPATPCYRTPGTPSKPTGTNSPPLSKRPRDVESVTNNFASRYSRPIVIALYCLTILALLISIVAIIYVQVFERYEYVPEEHHAANQLPKQGSASPVIQTSTATSQSSWSSSSAAPSITSVSPTAAPAALTTVTSQLIDQLPVTTTQAVITTLVSVFNQEFTMVTTTAPKAMQPFLAMVSMLRVPGPLQKYPAM